MSYYDDNPWRAPGDSGPERQQEQSTRTQAHEPVTETWERQRQEREPEFKSTPRAKLGFWRWIAVASVAALIGGGVGAFTAVAADDEDGSSSVVVAPTPQRVTGEATPTTIRSVLDRVQPAVVTIQASGSRGTQGSGTGMIISSDGEVLTNAHVVSGGREIFVTIDGEQRPRPARLLGADPSIDTALIKIENASDLPTVTFGGSNEIAVGDGVVAIGNALALPGGPSVTAGIVSAVDRSIADATVSLDDLIQTDAAINPGNSGGPLANMTGEVIGMNTAVIRGSGGEFQNIGFALAIDSILPALEDLRSGRVVAPAFLGVSTVTLDEGIRQRYGLTPESGAVIDSVQPGSPADDAGLSRFDVITEFDGEPVRSNDALVRLVRAKKPGDSVNLVFYRGDERREARTTLASRDLLR